MFHNRTGRVAALILLLSVSAQPITTYAAEGAPPPAATQSHQAPTLKDTVSTKVEEFSLEQLRRDTKAKISDTQQWVSDRNMVEIDLKTPLQTLDTKIDRLQDDMKPAGASLKKSLKNMVPDQGLVNMGGRKVSVWAIIMVLAFGLVLFLMSASGPTSRLGGRH